MLSHHSSVFSDMFSVPEPQPGGQELYEGAPVVQMTDSAEDLGCLFSILYDPTSNIPVNAVPTDWKFNQDHVAMLLSLARKYQIDSLHKRMVTHLEAYWPSALDEWSKIDSWYGKESRLQWRFRPEPVQAINLAREYDIPSILPIAYYFLSTLNPDYNWEVCVKKHPLPLRTAAARWNSLTRQDLIRLILGRRNINEFIAKKNIFGFHKHKDDLSSKHPCLNAPVECVNDASVHWNIVESECLRSPDTLQVLERFPDFHRSLCRNCTILYRDRIKELRTNLWDNLASFFKLTDDSSDAD